MNTLAPPWPESAYRFDLPHPLPGDLAVVAGRAFDRVWRTTLDRPGFAVVRFAGPVESRALRRVMLELVAAFPMRFAVERAGRFDQQVTSRFHRDGAPPASLLLLGYEASPVRSRLFVADAHRAAAEAGIGITGFLAANNPMLPAGDAKLRPYTTELAVPHGESFIVVINNSLVPDADGGALFGVLHKAEVPDPDPSAWRVINSVGLTPGDGPGDASVVKRFLARDDLD